MSFTKGRIVQKNMRSIFLDGIIFCQTLLIFQSNSKLPESFFFLLLIKIKGLTQKIV